MTSRVTKHRAINRPMRGILSSPNTTGQSSTFVVYATLNAICWASMVPSSSGTSKEYLYRRCSLVTTGSAVTTSTLIEWPPMEAVGYCLEGWGSSTILTSRVAVWPL